MGSIKNYPEDSTVSINDKLLGTDSSSNTTYNYTLGQIMEDVGSQYFPPLVPEGAGSSSDSSVTEIHLSDSRDGKEYMGDNDAPLTGGLTINLIDAVPNGWARVSWTSPDGSYPTITVINGAGKGIDGADITSVGKTIGSLSSAGDYEICFDYGLKQITMWSPDANGASVSTTPSPVTGLTLTQGTFININPVTSLTLTEGTF